MDTAPTGGEGLSSQSPAELSSGLSGTTTFHYEPSACHPRRWHSHRLCHLVGGAVTGGAIVLWLGELRGWEFRCEGGLWKISRMLVTLDCMTTLERGWGMLTERILPFPPRAWT